MSTSTTSPTTIDALRKLGAEPVGPVAKVADALALIDREPPIAGAILDISLRGEMSFPVADELERRSGPFVFATGYKRSFIPDRYGYIATWEKPYETETLARS